MSREVPLDQPLSDDDRAYLHARGEHARVDYIDQQYPPEGKEELDAAAAEQVVADADDETPPEVPPEPPTTELGDNYDDESVWSYKDLQTEAGARGLAKTGSRQELVVRLREWDSEHPDA